MTRQGAFTFDWPVDYSPENYIVSGNNRMAHEAVTHPRDWPFFCAVLHGAPASGKTHLAQIFAAQTGGVLIDENNLGQPVWQYHRAFAIDNVERFAGDKNAEEALFHLFNATKANDDRLLFTTAKPLDQLDFALPDLRSRLLGSLLITLGLPDEDMLTALYTKAFHDRQILVKPDVVAYLVTHAERSFLGVQTLVQLIDQWTLANGKAVTIPTVKKILESV